MKSEELFRKLLGLEDPWIIKEIRFDVNGKELDYQLIQVPSGTNGSFGFKQFERVITIPYGVQYVKFYLSAGLADTPGNPGKTYFSDLSISKISSFL